MPTWREALKEIEERELEEKKSRRIAIKTNKIKKEKSKKFDYNEYIKKLLDVE